MHEVWIPKARWLFLVATILGLFSTVQGYRLTTLNPRAHDDVAVLPLLVLNLALWYVPAAMTRPIFWLSSRFRLDSPRWLRAVAVHAAAALTFSILHFLVMLSVRVTLFPELSQRAWPAFLAWAQGSYLTNLDWTLTTYAAIVGLCYALAYYREAQARALKAATLETRLMEARLRTLEAELHPHFLFNTLHAISTLIHSDAEAADRMISRLSDLLRLTFDRSGAAQIPLKEELEFLQKYLQIEQIRFHDRLSVRFEIDPEALDVEVPRLILQPLVENAIKHGIGPRSGHGLVQISAVRQDEGVWIEVRDDGVGLGSKARGRLHEGVGLSNTRARLDCLYGPAHRLNVTETGSGLAVRLLVPVKRPPPPALEASVQVA